jgi:hypothetical protein
MWRNATSEEQAFKVIVSIFLPIVFVVCLIDSINSHQHLERQDGTVGWEPVNATVVSSEVVWKNCDEDGCSILPDITYEYETEGGVVEASRISFPWDTVSSDRLREEQQWLVVEDFPVGANVTAYVDPDNREESVLYIGMMGEHDVYSIVQDQYDSTVPFVFISPVLYLVAIRFISPIIRARTSKGSGGREPGTSDVVSYWSSDSPAEKREKEAVEQQWIHRPEQIGQKASTAPVVQPSGAEVDEPAPERKKDEVAPFWVGP